MQKINVAKHFTEPGDSAGFLIFRAMIRKLKLNDNPLEKFNMGDSTECEVEMTVNGVSVDILGALTTSWKMLEARFDTEVRKKAIELVTAAGLNPLREVLEEAENKIREKLQIWDPETYE